MFDLEKAIATWRQALTGNPIFSVDDIDELESHIRDQVVNLMTKGTREEAAYRQAIREMGGFDRVDTEYKKVLWGKIRRRNDLGKELNWKLSMLSSYLKVALRNIRSNKIFSIINIGGLGIGLACCLLAMLYVASELSYDGYHSDAERIYRIAVQKKTTASDRSFAFVSGPVAPTLKENYPQIEEVARLATFGGTTLVRLDDRMDYEDGLFYADERVFDVLTLPFVEGDPATALGRQGVVVLTKEVATSYFGDQLSVGRTLLLDGREYEVTGVIQDLPVNTHLRFRMLLPIKTFDGAPWMEDWSWVGFFTYLKLSPGVDINDFSGQISNLADTYAPVDATALELERNYFLQPITSIHLSSNLAYEAAPAGSVGSLYVISLVGLFILIIAVMNFVNLSTARFSSRIKEVCMRKVVGAERGQLIKQFLGESFLFSCFAYLIGLLVALLALPVLNDFAGTDISPYALVGGYMPSLSALLVISVGLVAGLYPAFLLSGCSPVTVVRGTASSGTRGSRLRKVLVVGQFATAITLAVGTMVVYEQVDFMKNRPLGFDKDQKLVIEYGGGVRLSDFWEFDKREFADHTTVQNVSVSSTLPGQSFGSFETSVVGEPEAGSQTMYYMWFEPDFISQFDIDLVAGRGFNPDMQTDTDQATLINESAVQAFGWETAEEAIGKRITGGLSGHEEEVREIIGVTSDFHFEGVHVAIEPLIMEPIPDLFRLMTLTVSADRVSEAVAHARATWSELYPDSPFQYFFLDEAFEQQYLAQDRAGKLFGIFSILGVAISCLGLFGLAQFTVTSRIREIGIRKAVGASVSSVVGLLTTDLLKWVLLGSIMAWPVAYLAMSQWLAQFADRMALSPLVFLSATAGAVLVGVLSVTAQTARAAIANPIDSLKHE